MLKHKNIQIIFVCLLLLLFIFSFNGNIKWFVFVATLFVWLIITIWGSFDIRSQYLIKTYNCNPNEKGRKIALTFDDGPTEFTTGILDVLKKHNAKATFFCIGTQIEKHPDIFRRIISEGHLAGNHSYSHSNRIGFFSTTKVLQEIQKNDSIIKSYLGKFPLLFRPPFGVTNPQIARAIAKTNHKVIGWNNRSLDTVIKDDKKIFKRIKRKLKAGGIVLLHDTSAKTADALEQLLLFLRSEDYAVLALDELLKIKPYED